MKELLRIIGAQKNERFCCRATEIGRTPSHVWNVNKYLQQNLYHNEIRERA